MLIAVRQAEAVWPHRGYQSNPLIEAMLMHTGELQLERWLWRYDEVNVDLKKVVVEQSILHCGSYEVYIRRRPKPIISNMIIVIAEFWGYGFLGPV